MIETLNDVLGNRMIGVFEIDKGAPWSGKEKKRSQYKRIMIVDDYDFFRKSLADNLRELGYTPLQQKNATIAIRDLTTENGIEMIVTDVEMPGIRGIEFTRRIRACEYGPEIQEIPIIVTSGTDRLSYYLESENKGANAFIRKPFSPKDVEYMRSMAMHISLVFHTFYLE